LAELKDDFNSLKRGEDNEYSKLQAKTEARLEKAFKEQSDALNFLSEKVRSLKEGKDADADEIVDKVLSKIPKEELTAEMIADKLETLDGDARLKISAIKNLEERLKELEDRPIRVGGGGTSDIGVAMSMSRIVKTETPSGTIDGSNKEYTVTSTINAVMSFAINGMVIHSDEYSISNKTITFTTALPSALSGKTFEIIYV